jgi:hypothetical protein
MNIFNLYNRAWAQLLLSVEKVFFRWSFDNASILFHQGHAHLQYMDLLIEMDTDKKDNYFYGQAIIKQKVRICVYTDIFFLDW